MISYHCASISERCSTDRIAPNIDKSLLCFSPKVHYVPISAADYYAAFVIEYYSARSLLSLKARHLNSRTMGFVLMNFTVLTWLTRLNGRAGNKSREWWWREVPIPLIISRYGGVKSVFCKSSRSRWYHPAPGPSLFPLNGYCLCLSPGHHIWGWGIYPRLQ